MANINLLPWRAELKQRQRQEYLSVLLASAIVAAVIMFGVSSYFSSQIDSQNQRNQFLIQESAILDQKIAELNDLKNQKEQLEQRLQLVQELQESRNLVTQLFNTLADIVPPGVYLERVEKTGRGVEIEGISESNNRLAALVRNIEEVDWLSDASIQRITMDEVRPKLLSRFVMTVEIVNPIKSDESKEQSRGN